MADASELAWSVQNDEIEKVKKCITKDNVNSQIKNGRNALHIAADYGHEEIIKYLIENGADVNLVDEYKVTALQAAIDEGHTDVVKLLLKAGANKNGVTSDGRTYQELAQTDDIKSLLK